MLSVEYHKNCTVISTLKINHINFKNVEKLRRLIVQLLRNRCKKLVLDLQGINFIDSQSFQIIDSLHKLAIRQNTEFEFTNVNSEVLELFSLVPSTNNYCIIKQEELPTYELVRELSLN